MTDTQQQAAAPTPEVEGGALRLTTAAPAGQTRVVLFHVDDKAYTVPKRIPGPATLAFLQVYRRSGIRAAVVWMFEDALGAEALEALHNCPGMTAEQLVELMEKVGKLYQGQIDELLGN